MPDDVEVTLDDLQGVYERRHGELHRVAAAIVGDRELARDVVQEGFVRAIRQRASYTARGSLEGWVWRIVVNTARDTRARGTRIDDDTTLGREPPAEADADDERRQLVRAAVEQLPERQRLVLFLRVYADLDYHSIADVLGIAEGTVAATLNAAHTRLRKLLMKEVRP